VNDLSIPANRCAIWLDAAPLPHQIHPGGPEASMDQQATEALPL
jgi:hypothetical protein